MPASGNRRPCFPGRQRTFRQRRVYLGADGYNKMLFQFGIRQAEPACLHCFAIKLAPKFDVIQARQKRLTVISLAWR